MAAKKLKTCEDLRTAWLDDERLELINGDIIKRPRARYEHGAVQVAVGSELAPYKKMAARVAGGSLLKSV